MTLKIYSFFCGNCFENAAFFHSIDNFNFSTYFKTLLTQYLSVKIRLCFKVKRQKRKSLGRHHHNASESTLRYVVTNKR
jgi:hypothetical protein